MRCCRGSIMSCYAATQDAHSTSFLNLLPPLLAEEVLKSILANENGNCDAHSTGAVPTPLSAKPSRTFSADQKPPPHTSDNPQPANTNTHNLAGRRYSLLDMVSPTENIDGLQGSIQRHKELSTIHKRIHHCPEATSSA
jgi:hypothetical protein